MISKYEQFIKENSTPFVKNHESNLSDEEKMDMIRVLYDGATDLQRAYFDNYADKQGFSQWGTYLGNNTWANDQIWSREIEEFKNKNRNLNWVSDTPMTLDECVDEFSDTLDGYNQFEPSLLEKLPTLFKPKRRQIMVYPAREGSVCIYVDAHPSKDFDIIRDELQADEVSVQEMPIHVLTGRTLQQMFDDGDIDENDWHYKHYKGKEYLEGTIRIWWD